MLKVTEFTGFARGRWLCWKLLDMNQVFGYVGSRRDQSAGYAGFAELGKRYAVTMRGQLFILLDTFADNSKNC